jgi:hypothetical protein
LLDGLANLREVPSPKHKPGRNPLQRVSDQRRSLALAGLAVGAVFSAAVVRRKRRGGEVELARPMPPPASESEAAEPTGATGTDGTNADVSAPAGRTTTVEPTSTPVEPATGELSAEEASILAVLAQSGRIDDDRTTIAIATSLERETSDVTAVLRKLGAEGVVAGDLYTAAGDKIWAVTERGVRRLGAQS